MSEPTQEQHRARILALTRAYCRKYLTSAEPYAPGQRIPYAGRVFDEEELACLVDSALDFWLTGGRYTDRFEAGLAEYLGVPYCSFVNSGSSANLLAFMALTAPELGERAIRRGDEVITVACGFPTTVAPILQFGAVPVFVDVTVPEYNLDPDLLEQARSPRTKAVMLAHTLGNPFDLARVKAFCDRYHYWLVEDNCDALGAAFRLDGVWQKTGTVGDLGTSSFYPAHHITTGEGGAVYTRVPLLHKIVRSLRDWGRDCVCPSGRDDTCGRRFDGQFGTLPPGFDHKYVYSHLGYNLKATDLQAAVGCAQLAKLPGFVERRNRNARLLEQALGGLEDEILLPASHPQAAPSWFGLPITCRQAGARDTAVRYLEQKGIQTRMLFAGNLLRHPCCDGLRTAGTDCRVAGSLEQTDRVMADTFWVGVYPGLSDDMLSYLAQELRRAVEQNASVY